MSEVVVTPSLDVIDLQHAHEQYADFVVIAFPMLSLQEFKERRQLPLNDTCASVFFAKTAHLKETDFLEIDRPILEMIGFKNCFVEQKDKNGNVKLDKNGEPKMKDTRTDFNHAIRCLRNMEGFCESDSFTDNEADYVIFKTGSHSRLLSGGHNKQELWLRKRMLEHLVIMANTKNSRMIREYFLDLKRIVTEYGMYQTVYRIKDSTISSLSNKLDHVINQNEMQLEKLTMMSKLLYRETENKVIDVNTKQKKQELVVLRNKTDPTKVEVLRGQTGHVQHQLKRKQDEMELVGKIDTYKNPVNLFNRFGESIKKQNNERFQKNNNKVTLMNGSTAEDLMTTFRDLENDKHETAKKVNALL